MSRVFNEIKARGAGKATLVNPSFCMQILWKLINTFLRGPDLRSAVETFKDLEELQEENMRITSGLCQSLIVQNDWERLMCVCQKMLEKKMPVSVVCVCVYTYMCVCVCACVYACTCVFVLTCMLCTYTFYVVYLYLYMCAFACAFEHVL